MTGERSLTGTTNYVIDIGDFFTNKIIYIYIFIHKYYLFSQKQSRCHNNSSNIVSNKVFYKHVLGVMEYH